MSEKHESSWHILHARSQIRCIFDVKRGKDLPELLRGRERGKLLNRARIMMLYRFDLSIGRGD